MIDLKNISFAYRKGKPVFEDLSVHLEKGHIYGLLGKNGAGKTTLLRLICGLNFIQGGTAEVSGFNPAMRHPDLLKQIYLLQEDPFVPRLTIKKYVRSYAPYYENFNFEQFDEYMHLFEIESKDAFLNQLSLGQKKKVMICFALAANTDMLFMDEPTNGLDIPSKTIFRKLLAMAANDDRLIIVSTHQVRDLHSLIDALVIVNEGKMLLNATIQDIGDKLCFLAPGDTVTDEPVLYCEENIRGNIIVAENIYHRESKVDIELLFNTVMMNKKRTRELFNSNC